MTIRPWMAVLLVTGGVAAIAAMLPLWPELVASGGGFACRGASLPNALRSDAPLLMHGRFFEALRAIDAAQYLTVSAMGAAVLLAAWGSARYLRAEEDPFPDHPDEGGPRSQGG